MPLVISHKAKCKYYIRNEEALVEILDHSDFDGEYWDVDDIIIFENGSEAKIQQAKGELSYTWSDPIPSDLHRVVEQINQYHPVRPLKHSDINSWDTLFTILSEEQEVATKGCLALLLMMMIVGFMLGFTIVYQVV